MSHFDDYQLEKNSNLFNCELIKDTIDGYSTLTEQEEAVLRFISNNPDVQYLDMISANTESAIMGLEKDYIKENIDDAK